MLLTLSIAALALCAWPASLARGCQLPTEWRPLSDGCRAELAEIIVYAKVLAIHRERRHGGAGSAYNALPSPYGHGYEGAEEGLLYSAEVELLCDQAWGGMLEVPAGSRLNVSGMGFLSCQTHSVLQGDAYIFFLRMDENYNILPHGVNFQDAIFPDTPENQRMFSSLFQFSNCSSPSQQLHPPSLDWQEDSRLLCSSVQEALFEEEERGRQLRERLAAAERRGRRLKERVRKAKRSLRGARQEARRAREEARALLARLAAATGGEAPGEAGERRAGHHLNAIVTQEEPPPRRQQGAALRRRTPL